MLICASSNQNIFFFFFSFIPYYCYCYLYNLISSLLNDEKYTSDFLNMFLQIVTLQKKKKINQICKFNTRDLGDGNTFTDFHLYYSTNSIRSKKFINFVSRVHVSGNLSKIECEF